MGPGWPCRPAGPRTKPLVSPNRERWGYCSGALEKRVGPREARPPPRGPKESVFSWSWDPAKNRPVPGRRLRRQARLESQPGPRPSGFHGGQPAKRPQARSPRKAPQGAPHATSISGARAWPRQGPRRGPTEHRAAPTTRPQVPDRLMVELPLTRTSSQVAPQVPRAARLTPSAGRHLREGVPFLLTQESQSTSPRVSGGARRAALGSGCGSQDHRDGGRCPSPRRWAETASQEQGRGRGAPPCARALSRICSCPFPGGGRQALALPGRRGMGQLEPD